MVKTKNTNFVQEEAWADWCPPVLKQIRRIMSDGKFCIEGNMADAEDTLMGLEGFFSSKSQWTYFDEYKIQPRTIAQLQKHKAKHRKKFIKNLVKPKKAKKMNLKKVHN